MPVWERLSHLWPGCGFVSLGSAQRKMREMYAAVFGCDIFIELTRVNSVCIFLVPKQLIALDLISVHSRKSVYFTLVLLLLSFCTTDGAASPLLSLRFSTILMMAGFNDNSTALCPLLHIFGFFVYS